MRLITMIGALACALLLSGCGGPELSAAPTPASSTPRAARTEGWEQVPPEHRRAFLRVLAKADPGLVDGDPQRRRGLRRAVYTCRDLERGEFTGRQMAERVAYRFTGGHGTVDEREAVAVIRAARKWICPHLKEG